MLIREEVKKQADFVKKMRRKLHSLAELSLNEVKTREFLRTFLVELGFKPKECGGGLICDIKSSDNQQGLIGLRADMDALPITEARNLAFKAQGNVMHACGHDGHMAMLLAVANILKNCPPKNNVRLIFQPAEEGFGGAKMMIKAGAAKDLTEVYALHLSPSYDEGVLATRSGTLFAGTCDFDITINGKKAHCAMPDKGVDTIKAAFKLGDALERVQKANPDILIHIGQIRAGSARNIIADQCEMRFSLRYFDESAKNKAVLQLTDELINIDQEQKTNHRLKIKGDYMPLINSDFCISVIHDAVEDIIEANPQYTAEDFSEFCNVCDGAMCWLGIKSGDYHYPLHSDMFGFNESALLFGIEYYLRIINKRGNNV